MSGLEVNKIIAAIIVALLVFVLISYAGDLIVKIDQEKNQETAYKIEIPEINSENSESAKSSQENTYLNIEPISDILMNASIEKGEKIYKKCGSCHNYKKDSANKIGPNLWNIVNRPKANIKGFAYSKTLAEFGGKWTYEDLSNFLYKPKDYIVGTKMNFSGLKKVEDRANLVLFLREQSDNPAPLP